MSKISVTGPKKHLEDVIEELHNLELMDLEQYDGELETGNPAEEAEDLSELLVDVRSLISKLPEMDVAKEEISVEEMQKKFQGLAENLEKLEDKGENLKRNKEQLKENKKFFARLKGSGLNLRDLNESKTLEVWVGRLERKKFDSKVESDRYEIFEGENASAIVYSAREEGIEEAIKEATNEQYNIPETDFSEGKKIEEVLADIKSRRKDIESELDEVKEEKKEIAEEWMPQLNYIESFLTEKVEKAEAPLMFATTEHAFIAEGWIPTEKFAELEERLANVSDGKIHVQEEEVSEEENPPVKHKNNRVVQPFESLTDLVAVPKYNEVDPSAVLMLTFPLFFGFMIGDAGYGLTSLAVFYGGYKMFPKAGEIFKSLMYASFATIFFGLLFGDAFGYVIFGHHSELAAVTGIHFFEKIPIFFHRAEHLGQVFTISAIIGLVHVNLGYGIGFYNEYIKHGFKEAFLEKGSWYVLQIGAGLAYLVSPAAGLPVMAMAIITLYLGEGIEGLVEIPSLLANILSYLRIFGVSVAAVALAAVVNSIASTAFGGGGLAGLVIGTMILLIGHVFNTFIKIMEGFLQGIRLHYVEMFQKFFEGGGKKYAPFGANHS